MAEAGYRIKSLEERGKRSENLQKTTCEDTEFTRVIAI